MAFITYEDKVPTRQTGLPRKYDVTADDLNEIKAVVNANASGGGGGSDTYFWTVELVDDSSISAYAPFDLKCTEIDSIQFSLPTITVNGFPLVIGDTISKGAVIEFSTGSSSVFNFKFQEVS